MKKSQFISLGILLIAVTIIIIVGAFDREESDPNLNTSPTATPDSTSAPLETPTPTNGDEETPTPTPSATPPRTPVVFPEVDKGYINSLSTETTTWYWSVTTDQQGFEYPVFNKDLNKHIDGFDYVFTNKNEDKKSISLTFNQGWDDKEMITEEILDILKKTNVKATFYLTKEYMNVEANHPIIKRMVDEGHGIGTRGSVSKQIQTLSTDNAIKDLLDMEDKLQDILDDNTVRMTSFRHIASFSRRDLGIVTELGYRIALWSYNYHDWEVLNKEQEQQAYNRMVDCMFDGTVYALAANSRTNANLLERLINEAKDQGFSFSLI